MALRNIALLQSLARLQIQCPVSHESFRLYSRWAHRRPAKVLLPFKPDPDNTLKTEKIIDLNAEPTEKFAEPKRKEKLKQPHQIKKVKQEVNETEESKVSEEKPSTKIDYKAILSKKQERTKKRELLLNQKKVFDENNEIIYEKLKENDGRVSTILVKLKSKKGRQESEQILVEGWRLIVDGLEAKCNLQYLIFSNHQDLYKIRPFLPQTGVHVYKMAYKEMKMWSDVVTPPGIFGVFKKPSAEHIMRTCTGSRLPFQLVCDNLREPGNLGAALRVAAGVGAEQAILTKGCADLWEGKVLRGGAGAHFRLPIESGVDCDSLPSLLPAHSTLLVAECSGGQDSVNYCDVDYAALEHCTLVVGGETEGISEEVNRLCVQTGGMRVHIPLASGVDSLNAACAAAVVAFEFRRQLLRAADADANADPTRAVTH